MPFAVCLLRTAAPLSEAFGGGGIWMETRWWECFPEKEAIEAPVLQVALFCASVAPLHYGGSACSSAWAGFSECGCTVLGTTAS